jgi:hypothetical protein
MTQEELNDLIKELQNLAAAVTKMKEENPHLIDDITTKVMTFKFEGYHALTIEELSDVFENMEFEHLESTVRFAQNNNETEILQIAEPILEKKRDLKEALPEEFEERITRQLKLYKESFQVINDIRKDEMFMAVKFFHSFNKEQTKLELEKLDLQTLQDTFDIALEDDEFEICDTILPILKKKQSNND